MISDLAASDMQTPSLPLPGAAQRLPTEIIQQIYLSLGPSDFQNARSTCFSWRYAGLDSWILDIQIRRGGWLGTVKSEQNNQIPTARSLSNVVARETALMSREVVEHDLEADSCLFQVVIDHCVDFPIPAFPSEPKIPSETKTETRISFWHKRLDTQSAAKHM